MRPLRTQRAQYLHDNLDLPEAAQFEAARWEHFQIAHLEDNSTFRIEDKARQIAWSWLTAAEAVADGLLTGTGTIFQSINLQEAQEKIRYAKNIIAALPPAQRPQLRTDNKQELEFDNGARLISLPGNPQRGKAQFHVVLDEFAHIREDTAVYTAILPVISKGQRRLRIGSSPMGATGRFWEIYAQEMRPYPGYRRKLTPWWHVHSFCKNVAAAVRMAPAMETAARVEMFGNDRLKAIYANMPEEDFQQEYEGAFVDEAVSYITWAEIKALQAGHSGPCLFARGVDQALAAVGELATKPDIERVLAGGVDIGRTRDTTELYLVGLSTLDSYPLRLAVTLDNVEFDDQYHVLETAVTRLPVVKMLIDQTGIGRNLAENMSKRFPNRVEGVDFTNSMKALWAGNSKMLTQQRRAPIPVDRDLAYQIHSIKRRITPSKNVVYDVETNEKHHADKFWAWALSLTAALEASVGRMAGVLAQRKTKGWQP